MIESLKQAAQQGLEALELAMDNLREHGDNCFLHDEGEYNSCFCGKDSLMIHLQSTVEGLAIALSQPAQSPQPAVPDDGESVAAEMHRLRRQWETQPAQAGDVTGEQMNVHVGNLPTMNQDEYPPLGAWWVQLWDGTGDDAKVIARVYGGDPYDAKKKAESIARAILALRPHPACLWARNGHAPCETQPAVPVVEAFAEGWRMAADWANRDDLLPDMDSPQYTKERDERLAELRPAVEPMTPMMPLTDSEMEKGREQIFSTNNPYCPCDRKTFRKVAQWVEWHHKIGTTAKAEVGEKP